MMEVKFTVTDKFLEGRPLSASSLKAFRESPRHYIDYLEKPWKDSPDFIIGRATESLIYEFADPDHYKFKEHFLSYEKFEKRSNDAKAKWAKMLDDAKSNRLTLIDQEQYKKSKEMTDCALQTDETRYYIDRMAVDKKTGRKIIQKKLSWTDKKTGLPVIGYIDFLAEIEDHLIIVDIKTDKDGSPDKFTRNASNLDYHVQVGAYLTGYHKQHYLFPDFMFMVIDKGDTPDAIMEHCPSDYCKTAKDEFDHLLTAFRHCMDEKQFHRGRHFWSAELGYFNMSIPKYKKMRLPND